jgi:asparagine synthase (glutamine-hydrolysing)
VDLSGALGALAPRGPDDRGVFSAALPDGRHVALGHTRLAIIDLSPAGHQPMSNEACPERRRGNETLWIAYNGEVYNHRDLHPGLVQRGHRFRSHSDTEVLLHLYEEKGEKCLEDLNGMFAFGLLDIPAGRLFLARDRFGEKPLYYYHGNGLFAFASEIKALLALPGVPREPDWEGLSHYFTFLFVPHPLTAFRGIRQLPPGHSLIYDLKRDALSVEPYWRLTDASPRRSSEGETLEAVRRLVEESVRLRMVSDVPLGVFLSGGIDSSVLTALMARESGEPLRTFTVLFEGRGIRPYDETEYARRVSRAYRTDHHELTVRIDDPFELFDLVRCFDQPFGNPTFYLSYLIARDTRRHVKVAISGAGGDELFGGYPRYKAIPFAPSLAALPRWLGPVVESSLKRLRENADNPFIRRIKLLGRGVGVPFAEQMLRWTYYFSDDEKQALLGAQFPLDGVRSVDRMADWLGAEGIDRDRRVMAADLRGFLSDNILEYTDKTSMAVGLEARCPFLDHRLVEFAYRLPRSFRFRRGVGKWILREAFHDLIPPENRVAPKRGFCPPISVWVSETLDSYFETEMPERRVRSESLLRWEEIQRLRAEHRAGQRDNAMELFGIMIFDAWYRRYILQTGGNAWQSSARRSSDPV